MFSQQNKELKITYNVLHDGRNYEEFLNSNGDIIISTTNPSEILGSKEETEEGFNTRHAAKIPKYTFIKKVSSNKVFIEIHLKESVIMKDILPAIEWTISSTETKMIGDFKCQRATASFRGSEIYAYFATEIPISLGPRKFYGLPGAILECGTTDRMNQWIATHIEYVQPTVDTTDWDFDFEGDYISFKDKAVESRNALIERRKRQNAKLPQGITTTTTYKRNGVEKVYEWELEEIEKQ